MLIERALLGPLGSILVTTFPVEFCVVRVAAIRGTPQTGTRRKEVDIANKRISICRKCQRFSRQLVTFSVVRVVKCAGNVKDFIVVIGRVS